MCSQSVLLGSCLLVKPNCVISIVAFPHWMYFVLGSERSLGLVAVRFPNFCDQCFHLTTKTKQWKGGMTWHLMFLSCSLSVFEFRVSGSILLAHLFSTVVNFFERALVALTYVWSMMGFLPPEARFTRQKMWTISKLFLTIELLLLVVIVIGFSSTGRSKWTRSWHSPLAFPHFFSVTQRCDRLSYLISFDGYKMRST